MSIEKNITIAENLARKMNTVAHKWEHVDIVRNDVLSMANDLGLDDNDKQLLEIAALMHDVGLDYCDDRTVHPSKSADIFNESYKDQPLTGNNRETINFLILNHDKYSKAVELHPDEKTLTMLCILVDADTLELLGSRGYERAVETALSRGWPDYDQDNPCGITTGYTSQDFDKRFLQKKEGKIIYAIEPTLVGQLNFQISCADLLFTDWAKNKSVNGINYLKNKIVCIIGK